MRVFDAVSFELIPNDLVRVSGTELVQAVVDDHVEDFLDCHRTIGGVKDIGNDCMNGSSRHSITPSQGQSGRRWI